MDTSVNGSEVGAMLARGNPSQPVVTVQRVTSGVMVGRARVADQPRPVDPSVGTEESERKCVMGRRSGSTQRAKRQQASKRGRWQARQPELDLAVRFSAQRDRERVWR